MDDSIHFIYEYPVGLIVTSVCWCNYSKYCRHEYAFMQNVSRSLLIAYFYMV